MTQWVYSFGAGHNEGRADMRNLLGGKGANLAEMASIGLPVPPGFTITTEVCTAYYDNGQKYPDDLAQQVRAALALIEEAVGNRFGDHHRPLLVSVRSGARRSAMASMARSKSSASISRRMRVPASSSAAARAASSGSFSK